MDKHPLARRLTQAAAAVLRRAARRTSSPDELRELTEADARRLLRTRLVVRAPRTGPDLTSYMRAFVPGLAVGLVADGPGSPHLLLDADVPALPFGSLDTWFAVAQANTDTLPTRSVRRVRRTDTYVLSGRSDSFAAKAVNIAELVTRHIGEAPLGVVLAVPDTRHILVTALHGADWPAVERFITDVSRFASRRRRSRRAPELSRSVFYRAPDGTVEPLATYSTEPEDRGRYSLHPGPRFDALGMADQHGPLFRPAYCVGVPLPHPDSATTFFRDHSDDFTGITRPLVNASWTDGSGARISVLTLDSSRYHEIVGLDAPATTRVTYVARAAALDVVADVVDFAGETVTRLCAELHQWPHLTPEDHGSTFLATITGLVRRIEVFEDEESFAESRRSPSDDTRPARAVPVRMGPRSFLPLGLFSPEPTARAAISGVVEESSTRVTAEFDLPFHVARVRTLDDLQIHLCWPADLAPAAPPGSTLLAEAFLTMHIPDLWEDVD